jgi:TP901 family phage tail tape measure protein
MGLSMRELMTLDIVARDDASPTIQKVSAASKAATVENGLAYKQASIRALTYSKVLRGVSKGLTLYGAAAIAVSAFAGKQAVDFQKQMGLVRTQTTLTNNEFKKLEAGVLSLATKTSQPIANLTQGLYDIFSSGLKVSGPQSIKMLQAISKAATAGDTDIRTVSRAALAEMNAFGLGAKGVNKVLDQQFQLLRFSQGTYDDLVSSLGNVISSAHQAGQSLTQMNAAIGFLTQRGMSFSQASISVARAMDFITRPEIAAKLKKVLGVDIVDAQGNFKKLSVIMTDMGRKMQGETLPQMKKTLSDVWGNGEIRANRFFNTVLPQIAAYNKNLAKTAKFHGALGTAFDKVRKTTSVLWGRMINQLKVVAIQFGSMILPAINKIISGVSKLFTWLSKLPDPVKHTVSQFVIWSGIIALILSRVLKLSAGFLSIVSMRLWSGMAAGAEGAASSIGKLGGAVLGTLAKFTLWGAVIGGAAFLIIKNFDTVKSWFEGFISWWQAHWKQIWNNIKPIVTFIGQAFMNILKTVGAALGGAIGFIGKFVAKLLLIKPVVQGIVVFLLAAIGVKLVEGIIAAFTAIASAFARFGAAMLAAAKANWIMLLVAALVTAAYLVIKNWAKVKDFFTKIFNGLARDAAQVANFFIRYFVNPIIKGIDAVVQALNDINPFKDIPKVAPVRSVQVPNKFVSNLGASASATNQTATATKALSDAASGASANISNLDAAIKGYTSGADKAGGKSKALTKSIRDIQKAIASQIKTVNQGKSSYFSLSQGANNLMSGPFGNGKISNAARVQAGAIRQAVAAQQRSLQSMLKNVAGGKQLAASLADMGNVSLKTKQKFAQLLAVTDAMGIKLSKAKLQVLQNDVNTHNLADANKVLSGAIKNVNDQLKGVKDKKVKVDVNTKNANSNIKSVQTQLKAVSAKTVWATINAHDEPIQKTLGDVTKKLDAVDKKTVWATINAHDQPAIQGINDTNSKLNQLASRSVSIPINVKTTTDPYAYGYAIGQQVAAGARAALQQKSPSKVFMRIGKDVIRGLIIGLRHAGLLKELDNTVGKITDIVKSMPEDLRNTMKLLGKGTSKALDQATKGFQHFMDKIDNLKNLIGTLKDSIQQHIKDIQSKLKDLDKAINDKSTKTAERAADILKKNKLEDQLKKWMDVSHLPSTLQGVAGKLQSWGNDLQRRMTALNNRVQSFVGDFRSGFQQGTDIVGILGGETDRKNINIRKFFRDKIAVAKKWAGTLKQLARKGLNPMLLQELAAAGPDALPLAQEILKIGVKYVNKQQGVLNTIMGQTQKYLVNTVFGDQIDQLAKEAKNFKNALAKLVEIIKRATDQANNNNPPNNKHHHKPGGGGNGNFEYHYHAPPKAETKEQIRELSWWWRTHRYGR